MFRFPKVCPNESKFSLNMMAIHCLNLSVVMRQAASTQNEKKSYFVYYIYYSFNLRYA